MEPIYHSSLEIPIISLINGIILIVGFYSIGGYLQKFLKIEAIINEVSINKYQNILISIIFSSIILYPICLFFENSNYVLKIYSYLIFILGFFHILLFFKKNYRNKIEIYFKKDLNFLIFISIFVGLVLLSFAPVTNADSLDYHLYTAKYLINNGQFPTYLTNFHSSYLSGSGEIFIALGLLVGSEQFGSILQLSGIISLIGVLKKYKSNYFFYLLIISSPVLIFFVSSVKPQLFTICSSAFAFCLLFCDRNISPSLRNYDYKKLFLISIILLSSITVKFSFILSSIILLSFTLFNNFNLKKIYKIIFLFLLSYIFIVLPSILWKYIVYSGSFIELFYSPFSTERYGLFYFKQYLVNLSEGSMMWFMLPTSLENFTHSLGLGTLSIIYFFYLRNQKKTYFLLLIVILFVLISYIFGQFTARFFLEPYFWITLYLAKNHKKVKVNIIHEFFYKVQSLIFLGIVFYGVSNLTIGVLNSDLRERVLENNAMGYKFFKWVNNELKKDNSPIISFERSISFSKNLPISRDHIFFVNMSKNKAKDYVDEIKNLNPKFIVFSSRDTSHKKYIGCTKGIYSYGKKIANRAVRNPLNKSNEKFDIYIYKLDTSLLPDCINPNKVDTYTRQ